MHIRLLDYDYAPSRVSGLPGSANLFLRYRRSPATMQLGAILLVLAGGMALVAGIANGQDRKACLDCSIGSRGARRRRES